MRIANIYKHLNLRQNGKIISFDFGAKIETFLIEMAEMAMLYTFLTIFNYCECVRLSFLFMHFLGEKKSLQFATV